jgi:hypothetical protein
MKVAASACFGWVHAHPKEEDCSSSLFLLRRTEEQEKAHMLTSPKTKHIYSYIYIYEYVMRPSMAKSIARKHVMRPRMVMSIARNHIDLVSGSQERTCSCAAQNERDSDF